MRLVPSPAWRLLVTGLVTGLAASLLLFSPARAAGPSAPGSFTGHGFDVCVAPSQSVMDTWNLRSPYSAIGIYVSGSSRYCGDRHQPNLSKAWVTKNASRGWRFLPIHVGRQAPCFKNNPKSRVQKKLMSVQIAKARTQAREEAAETVAALKKYGFGAGSLSYLDIEWYARTKACDKIVFEFADAWTERLHAAGFKSGLYSSGSAAIKAVDEARAAKRAGFTLPDQMWIAWTNKVANTDGGTYLGKAGWTNHQRIHQYENGVNVTYGGYTINIDRDFLDVGKGSVATKKQSLCDVNITFSSYPKLAQGSKGAAVSALQCLLTKQGFTTTINGTFGTSTRKALEAFRKDRHWGKKSVTTRPTWTVLLSAGSKPRVLKQGSVGEPVWRLQRSLVAAGLKVTPNGLYDSKTVTAVKAYRKTQGRTQYATTEPAVWSMLQRGETS